MIQINKTLSWVDQDSEGFFTEMAFWPVDYRLALCRVHQYGYLLLGNLGGWFPGGLFLGVFSRVVLCMDGIFSCGFFFGWILSIIYFLTPLPYMFLVSVYRGTKTLLQKKIFKISGNLEIQRFLNQNYGDFSFEWHPFQFSSGSD